MPSPPYDTAEYVLNMARTFVNDAGLSLAGNLLSDTQPYTLTYLNTALRKLQNKLVDNGVETFVKEAILTGMTPVAVNDPGVQVYINWSNYFDGVTLNASPVLPQDMIIPLRLWERQTGTTQEFREMLQAEDGLPSGTATGTQGMWDWRTDSIYFPGANQSVDLRMRYDAYLAEITATSQPIPIMRCANALANYVAQIFANARGSPLADSFGAKGDEEVEMMANRTARRKQRRSIRRRPYGGNGRTTGLYIR